MILNGKFQLTRLIACNFFILLSTIIGFGQTYEKAPIEVLRRTGFEKERDLADFHGIRIRDRLVYYKGRQIGEAIVQKDHVIYELDHQTGRLLDFRLHWREDLPDHLPKVISREQAVAQVGGKLRYARLFYLADDCEVTPIRPVPKQPCWIVHTVQDNGEIKASIVDAISGRILGPAIPPPYEAFSFSGPMDTSSCSSSWNSWYRNAENWFNAMGYPTEAVLYPNETKMREHIASEKMVLFYELAHGASTSFKNDCGDSTSASEITNWLASYTAVPFAFIGSCGGMCSTGPGTLSHAFRKGSLEGTVTVGYCGMADEPCVADCWYAGHTVSWQNKMFEYMSQGFSIKEAFDQANLAYPTCASGACFRFVGDEALAVIPKISRTPFKIIRLEGDLTFGNVIAGQTSQRMLTIYNDGTGLLTVTGITFPLGFNSDWTSGTIAAHSFQEIMVMFAPTQVQAYGGIITVVSDSTSVTYTISCSGTGMTYSPPSTPILINPENGATVLTLTPIVQASSFFDPDGDSHANSHWQIDNDSDFSCPEWDSGDDYEAYTQVIVPSDRLNYNTTYFWRVRYKDSREMWSNWSTSNFFITIPPVGEYSGGTGTLENPYQISTVDDWQELMTTSSDWTSHFILTADLDLSGVTVIPVGTEIIPFTGVLDGNGHSLQNVVINLPDTDYVGLFGYLGEGGQIRNLGVVNFSVTGRNYVGGLCGYNSNGAITNCNVTKAVTGGTGCIGGLCGHNERGTISDCSFIGIISGRVRVGGMSGYNSGTIISCYASGDFSVSLDCAGGLVGTNTGIDYDPWDVGKIISCYCTASVSGTNYVGGLVGWNVGSRYTLGTITSSYAIGSVSGVNYIGGLVGYNCGTITTCYAAGPVTGGYHDVGGLVGSDFPEESYCHSQINSSFWDMETTGQTASAGGTGLTTAEMQTLSTFTDAGWDFVGETANGTDDIWIINQGRDYPQLRELLVLPADLNKDSVSDLNDFIILSSQWGMSHKLEGTISPGEVEVDGNLADWPDQAEWIPLNQIYDGTPTDISDARFALRWSEQTNRLYAAVVVTDMDHVFSDGYEKWNAGDRIEVYCQGSAAGGIDWQGDYDIAQQYYIARNFDDSSWASWADGQPIATDAGLEYAVSLSGAVIVYEAAITAFDTYGGLTGGPTVETDLEHGKVIGLDITALTRTAPGGYGMLSANTMTGKYLDAGKFAQYMLVPAGDCQDLSADLDGDCVVDLDDLAILAENWLWP